MEERVDLETYLNNLIAEIDGVKPEDVTVEYIRQQREKRIYPFLRYNCWDGFHIIKDGVLS